jgi:hypothetical protein
MRSSVYSSLFVFTFFSLARADWGTVTCTEVGTDGHIVNVCRTLDVLVSPKAYSCPLASSWSTRFLVKVHSSLVLATTHMTVTGGSAVDCRSGSTKHQSAFSFSVNEQWD